MRKSLHVNLQKPSETLPGGKPTSNGRRPDV
uniref:Uncharacterized protein n=1 Tax=Neisseria meningitidis alpha275 TaxID=295996 RepID=C6SKY0_NEIME|nr:hypothetical protein predicted by Glimmer/Critica [Neisseria meningitidis alpha275]